MLRWEYLISKEFKIRHHIAEYYINNSEYIIDIGTYRHKIATNKKVIYIDPLQTVSDSFCGTLSEWKKSFYKEVKDKEYSVVALGLHLEGDSSQIKDMIEICDGASVIVLEIASDFKPSLEQYNLIRSKLIKNNRKKIICEMNITLSDILNVDGFKPFVNRKICVFKNN
jgi:hypothetical protein